MSFRSYLPVVALFMRPGQWELWHIWSRRDREGRGTSPVPVSFPSTDYLVPSYTESHLSFSSELENPGVEVLVLYLKVRALVLTASARCLWEMPLGLVGEALLSAVFDVCQCLINLIWSKFTARHHLFRKVCLLSFWQWPSNTTLGLHRIASAVYWIIAAPLTDMQNGSYNWSVFPWKSVAFKYT